MSGFAKWNGYGFFIKIVRYFSENRVGYALCERVKNILKNYNTWY
jgi:hypothetical protein